MKRKLKDAFVKFLTIIIAVCWTISWAAFDSECYLIPAMVNICCSVYLALFLYANQMYFWKWERGDL